MIKAIIFDYFGVLATDESWQEVVKATKANHSIELRQAKDSMNTGEISWAEFCDIIAKELNVSLNEVAQIYDDFRINKQLTAYIKSLKNQGYKIGLLSNASAGYLEPILTKTGMQPLFDAVIISSNIGFAKPHPQAFNIALERLEVTAHETIFIDDLPHNVKSADLLGIHSIQYKNNEKLKSALLKILSQVT